MCVPSPQISQNRLIFWPSEFCSDVFIVFAIFTDFTIFTFYIYSLLFSQSSLNTVALIATFPISLWRKKLGCYLFNETWVDWDFSGSELLFDLRCFFTFSQLASLFFNLCRFFTFSAAAGFVKSVCLQLTNITQTSSGNTEVEFNEKSERMGILAKYSSLRVWEDLWWGKAKKTTPMIQVGRWWQRGLQLVLKCQVLKCQVRATITSGSETKFGACLAFLKCAAQFAFLHSAAIAWTACFYPLC